MKYSLLLVVFIVLISTAKLEARRTLVWPFTCPFGQYPDRNTNDCKPCPSTKQCHSHPSILYECQKQIVRKSCGFSLEDLQPKSPMFDSTSDYPTTQPTTTARPSTPKADEARLTTSTPVGMPQKLNNWTAPKLARDVPSSGADGAVPVFYKIVAIIFLVVGLLIIIFLVAILAAIIWFYRDWKQNEQCKQQIVANAKNSNTNISAFGSSNNNLPQAGSHRRRTPSSTGSLPTNEVCQLIAPEATQKPGNEKERGLPSTSIMESSV